MPEAQYKLLTFEKEGRIRPGLFIEGQVYDVASATGRDDLLTMETILERWSEVESHFASAAKAPVGSSTPIGSVRVLAPLKRPAAIYCAGSNYKQHNDNMANAQDRRAGPSSKDLGLPPFCFLKSSNCIADPDAQIATGSEKLDYEVELAVVIGRAAFKAPVEGALECVAGYTIANDLSARDRILRQQVSAETPFRWDWLSHKNFDGSCPLGPYIVPARFIPDPQNLTLKTWVNDEVRQSSSTANMLYSVAELVSALSKFTTLRSGDIILTGTPAGVGAETGNFLKSGDVISMEIEAIGRLRNTVGQLGK